MKVLLSALSTTVCPQLLFALNYCLRSTNTQFHEDFANSKKNLKDLEVMFKKQCNSAFEEAACVRRALTFLSLSSALRGGSRSQSGILDTTTTLRTVAV